MDDISKEKPDFEPVTTLRWLLGYVLLGLGLLALAFLLAAKAPADAIGLGGFLCFFTLGVTLMVEGTKRWRAGRRKPRSGAEG